jgi:hypothetical protein
MKAILKEISISTYINFSETLRDKNKMFYYESLPSVNSIKTTWDDNSKLKTLSLGEANSN